MAKADNPTLTFTKVKSVQEGSPEYGFSIVARFARYFHAVIGKF